MAFDRSVSILTARPLISLFAAVPAFGLLLSFPRILAHYRSWLSIGPGGVPYNLLGWLAQSILSLLHVSSDMVDTHVYTSPTVIATHDSFAIERYIPADLDLPVKTDRPVIPRFFAPQRQTSMTISPALKRAQRASLAGIVAANQRLVRLAPSKLEGGHCSAIFLLDSAQFPRGTARVRGEVCHAHTDADGSLHVTLSLVDAKEVVEKGWGQRHMASGTLLPLGYTMVYAPTDEGEVEMTREILKAGVRYMTRGAEVL